MVLPVPGQRLSIYRWLLLCAMAVSILYLFQLNLVSFTNLGGIVVSPPGNENANTTNLTTPGVERDLLANTRASVVSPNGEITKAQAQHETKPQTSSPDQVVNDQDDAAENTVKQDKPLNIVLLYADDWTHTTLGVAGNSYVQTPRLDEMARRGILFTHNCVVASICMQSRATLYTGQYSSVHQTFFSYRNVTMYEEGKWNQTLYPLMKKAGYHVGFFGKYHHLEPPPRNVPTFDEFITTPFSHYVFRNGITKHITEWNEEDGLKFLKHKPSHKPFFLTVSFFATHAEDGSIEQYRPMQSSMNLYLDGEVPLPKTYTQEHWERMPNFFNERNFGRARFQKRYSNHSQYQHHMKNTYRMVTEVDAVCGRIMDYLNSTGELDNTLVLFTTDNGNSHGQHGLAEKWYAYEESLRVPLIILDPRAKSPGVISDFTLNIDLAPTILSAAGVPVPPVMQGTDMADLYLRHKQGRQEFLYEYWQDIYEIPNSLALVQKDFKYIYWYEHNYHQAFNLTNDPFEETDLFHTISRDDIATLKQRIADFQSSIHMGSIQ